MKKNRFRWRLEKIQENVKYIALFAFIIYVGLDLFVDFVLYAEFEFDDLFEVMLISIAGYFSFREFARNKDLMATVKAEKEKNSILSEELNLRITRQFENWRLTAAEQETAWLIIRGFAIKEIATLRSVAEKTVHHQLSAVYNKSGTRNRAEFTTYFIQLLFECASDDENSWKQMGSG